MRFMEPISICNCIALMVPNLMQVALEFMKKMGS
jgi:hypothetical protein